MANFPWSLLPNVRKPETADIPGSPRIFNARDYNVHRAELVAIESTLAGGSQNLITVLTTAVSLLDSMTNGGLLSKYCGTISNGSTIPLPQGMASTQTNASANINGVIATTDTTIPVLSTVGFPQAGYLTKFNSLSMSGVQAASQEVISYTGYANSVFTGCVRDPVSAQVVQAPSSALIIPGRASVMVSCGLIGANGTSGMTGWSVWHDSTLNVRVTVSGQSPGASDASYSLVVVGSFADVDIAALFPGVLS